MRRIGREAIRMRIHIALTTLRPSERRSAGLIEEIHRESLVTMLTDQIMGPPESEAVILVPDLYGPPLSPYHGKWDVEEPHPHPDLPVLEH